MAPLRSAGAPLRLAGLAALVGLLCLVGRPTRAGEGTEIDPAPKIVYDFSGKMQFGLSVIDPEGKKNAITLAYNGDTNNTDLRIDGKDVEFGSKEGKFVDKRSPLGDDKKGVKSVWEYQGIQVTQVLRVVPSAKAVKGKRRMDTALIVYHIKNTSDKAHKVGLRCVIDTLIADNDGNPFVVAGKEKELIKTSADFRGNDVPKYVKALREEDLEKPGFTAYLTLKVGGGIQPPDRFSITAWPGASPVWDVPVKNTAGDSAVVMYWDQANLEPNATRNVGFAYGGGEAYLGEKGKKTDNDKD